MTNAIAVLSIARDALAELRWVDAFAVFAQLGPDFVYRERRTQLRHPRPYFVTDYGRYEDEDGDPEPLDDQRRRLVREWRSIDWTAWREPQRATISTVNAVLQELYPPRLIATLSATTADGQLARVTMSTT